MQHATCAARSSSRGLKTPCLPIQVWLDCPAFGPPYEQPETHDEPRSSDVRPRNDRHDKARVGSIDPIKLALVIPPKFGLPLRREKGFDVLLPSNRLSREASPMFGLANEIATSIGNRLRATTLGAYFARFARLAGGPGPSLSSTSRRSAKSPRPLPRGKSRAAHGARGRGSRRVVRPLASRPRLF